MSEEEKQESQKTVVAFIAGLLIGGLLVWVFGGAPQEGTTPENDNGADTEENGAADDTSDAASDDDDGSTTNDGNSANEGNDGAVPAAELPTGDGDASVSDQSAGARVALNSATYPTDEGWIGVRDYTDGEVGGILGVVRYSKEQGLVPEEIILQRATVAGNTYAVVFFNENGDRQFNPAQDAQVGGVMDTFQAE